MEPIEEKKTLPSPLYDYLNKVVRIVLPAIGTLYFSLSGIWGLPAGEQVVATCAALALFGGVLVSLSAKNYQDTNVPNAGDIVVTGDPGGITNASLELAFDPDELLNKQSVTFQVKRAA